MTEIPSFCASGECPDIDPATGRFKGTSTVKGRLENGTEATGTVKYRNLATADLSVRLNGLSMFGNTPADQQERGVKATVGGEKKTLFVAGNVLGSEAKQARDARGSVLQRARQVFGGRASRPAPARA